MHVTHSVHVSAVMAAPAEAVWARISQHDETHRWVLAARVRVISPGSPDRNGLGAVREVAFPAQRFWSTLQERVVAFEPPTSFSYEIIAGMPGLRGHLGTLSIESLAPERSRLTWHVDFDFSPWHPFRLIATRFTRTFSGVLQDALDELARQFAPSMEPGAAA